MFAWRCVYLRLHPLVVVASYYMLDSSIGLFVSGSPKPVLQLFGNDYCLKYLYSPVMTLGWRSFPNMHIGNVQNSNITTFIIHGKDKRKSTKDQKRAS